MTDEALYELHQVGKSYGRGAGTVDALRAMDLRIAAGELVVVAGPSGSGKTTLLQLLGGLDRPSSGTLLFQGGDMDARDDAALTRLRLDTIGFVFQQFNLIPTLTARENVDAALAPLESDRATLRARAAELLESVGLTGRQDHLPSQLSGGEQQRVAIARALANDPRVILADEPTGNLDSTTGSEVLALLQSLHEEQGRTIVLVTHDAAIAAGAPRVVHMRDGTSVDSRDSAGVGK